MDERNFYFYRIFEKSTRELDFRSFFAKYVYIFRLIKKINTIQYKLFCGYFYYQRQKNFLSGLAKLV